jgi:hypothetical protein
MAVREILLLGNTELHRVSTPVNEEELETVRPIVRDLFDTMAKFQAEHGWGRAIAGSPTAMKTGSNISWNWKVTSRNYCNRKIHEHHQHLDK